MADYTKRQRQAKYNKKRYKAGLKHKFVWVKRRGTKAAAKMSRGEFSKALNKLTSGWDKESLSQLYGLLIEITIGKKEEAKLIKKK